MSLGVLPHHGHLFVSVKSYPARLAKLGTTS